mmetsp:Transcript_47038/g.142434  ORF Transcript_47038/g.142434 Transcript_47038/m.142434 type:complete len:762 (-) Transcript_47038:198-2483(-)|eukprot:CAMPEP_0113597826 /NCGR_PEP_ID=MMETSP0015_2-20120614/41233_1 /TAXON_ID=2838 /ORGANISM="Odontella" /LENGTH=761 /DNA_ID=CAMNT_0000505747 /DNA_START=679 /DNA_END=2964 /DNA_ORIENTATION=+ /assembly_acc=CAM_ASM_000160
MGISRKIVEAVRARDPPGRFLEKDQATSLWFDISDKKAIEKTSQALRDSAASLRKQLSEDLADPDFLKAVFDEKTAKELSDMDKPKKSAKPPKGHRRTRSDPMGGKANKSAAKRPSVGLKDQKIASRKSVSLTGPLLTASSAQKSQKRSSAAKKSHKRIHSADSVPTNGLYSKESAPGSPYPRARRSSPASPCGYQRMSPPASPYSYNHALASPPNSPYTYNYGPGPPSPYHINHHRAQSWDVSNGYQQPSPGQHAPENGFKPVGAEMSSSHGESSGRNGETAKSSPSPVQYSNPQHYGFAPSSPTPYIPYPPSPHQPHLQPPYYAHHYPLHVSHSPGHPASAHVQGANSDQRPPSLVIPELGKDSEKNSRASDWFPKPQTSMTSAGSSNTPSSNGSHALGPRPHHYPYYQGHHHYPQATGTSMLPPTHWPQPPPSPRQRNASPDSAHQQSNWPNPPSSSSRQKDSPPASSSQTRPPPSPRPGASSPSSGRSLHTSRPPPSPRQRPCSPGPSQLPLHPPRPPPSPSHGANSPGHAPTSLPPPRPPASPKDGSHKTHPPLRSHGGRTSPMLDMNSKRFSYEEHMSITQSQDSGHEECSNVINEQTRTSFAFVDGKLQECTENSVHGQDDDLFQKVTTSAQQVTPSPERHQRHTERVSYWCSPEAVEAVESFDLSPVADIDQMDDDYQESHSCRDPRKGNGDDPALESMDADIEVSPLPYRSNPLQELGSSPLRELNENLLLLSPSSLSPPRGIHMASSFEDF